MNTLFSLKDEREKFHLSVFSSLYCLPGEELLRQDTGQKPDFLYQAGKLVIGIEHTELKRTKSAQGKHSLAERKGLHRQIVERARQHAIKQEIPPINVDVWFNDRFDRYPNKGEKAEQGLLSTITTNLDKILASEYGNSTKIKVPDPFVGISQIYARSGRVHGKVWLKAHRWQVVGPSRIMLRSFLPDLQAAISAKNKKIDEYHKNCDECWLLIVADRSKADQCYYPPPDIQGHSFVSKFKRTFFLEIMERDLLELSTI